MKITDTLGRTLDIDIVVKATMIDGWMEPLGYKLDNEGTTFLRVPNGPFALRVMSQLGADVLVHLDGKHLLTASVAKGVQYVEHDLNGKPFYFGAQDGQSEDAASAEFAHRLQQNEAIEGDTAGDGAEHPVDDVAAGKQAPLAVPTGHGLLFVVARFADDPANAGYQQPPRQEYGITLQLRSPADHDRNLAGSLSKIVEPPLPPDPDDIVKMTPGNHPTFVCNCKSHGH
jgi:hypothetical protein